MDLYLWNITILGDELLEGPSGFLGRMIVSQTVQNLLHMVTTGKNEENS